VAVEDERMVERLVETAVRRPVTLMVVDDQPAFRDAVRVVVRLTQGFQLVAEAASGEAAVALARLHRPDLVLMDLELPGVDGAGATREITRALPDTVVVLISTYRRDDLPDDLEACGAVAYVRKEQLGPTLLEGLWRTHAPG
jgi:two-component system invasion response regulator UvrY